MDVHQIHGSATLVLEHAADWPTDSTTVPSEAADGGIGGALRDTATRNVDAGGRFCHVSGAVDTPTQ